MAKLILREAGTTTSEFDLEEKGSATIGRSPDCDITIVDTQASRRHCSVVRLQSGFEVADLGSTNGTLVNSTLVKRQKLKHGDVIRIGAVELVFDDPSSAGAAAEPAVGYLVHAKGDRKGEKFELTAQRTTVGRKETNTLVLDDPVCSSYHCEIVRDLNGYTLRDLGSTNGTLVNGEMVTEAQLHHGARVRIGNTRFVFQDPAMAEIDLELVGAEEEDEWGMMRDIDLAAVRKRNPATVVYALLFVGILGAGGYFVTKERPATTGADGPQSPPNNMVEDWSAESAGSRFSWRGEPAGAVVVRHSTAVLGEGRQSLEFRCNVSSAPVYYATTFSADRARYRLRGKVAARGGARARLGILWTGLGLERWSTGPWIEAGALVPVDVGSTAPPWASRLRLGVLIEGEGTVYLDDVFLGREGAPMSEEIEQNDFHLWTVDGRRAELFHLQAPVLANGRVFVRDASGGEVDAPGLRLGAEAQDAEHIVVTIEGAGDAALAGVEFEEVSGYLSRGGFRAFTPDQPKAFHGSFPDDGTLALEGVRKLLLGPSGRALAALAVNDDGRLQAEARVEDGRRTFALLGPPAEGRFVFRFKTNLRGETTLANERMAQALALHRQGRLGEFLAAAQQALAEFPFASRATRDQLKDLITEVNAKYAETRMRVDRELQDYKEFKDMQDLADGEAALRELRDSFQVEAGEGPRGQHYAAAVAELEQLKREALRKWQSERAELSWQLAKLIHEPAGEVYSAALHYAYITQYLPESERAAAAKAELEKIEQEHPDLREVLNTLPPPETR